MSEHKFDPNKPLDESDSALPVSLDWVKQELEFRERLLSNPYVIFCQRGKPVRKEKVGDVHRSADGDHPYRVTAVDKPATTILAIEPITEAEYDRRLREQQGNLQ